MSLSFWTTLGCIAFVYYVYQRAQLAKRYPNYLTWSLPLLGHGLTLARMLVVDRQKNIIDVFKALCRAHGGICTMQLGLQPMVVISEPTLIRSLLKNPKANKRRPSFIPHPMMTLVMLSGGGNGIIADEGASWKQKRQLIHQSIVSGSLMDAMIEPIVAYETTYFLQQLAPVAKSSGSMDINNIAQLFSLNIISSLCYGERYDKDDTKAATIMAFTNEFLEQILKLHPTDFWPAINYVWKGHANFIASLRDRRDSFFQPIIARHREAGNTPIDSAYDEPKGQKSDIVDALLAVGISDLDISMVLQDLIVAGTETTANSFLFFLGYMANYPDIQGRCRREIEAYMEKEGNHSRLVGWHDCQHLPFLKATMKETIRLSPVAHLSVPHYASDVIELPGMPGKSIPKDAYMFFVLSTLGDDPSAFPDPSLFNPDRHLGKEEITVVGGENDIAPFGIGSRSCLGWRLSKTELFVLAANTLYLYNVTPGNGKKALSLRQQFKSSAYPAETLNFKFESCGKDHLIH